MKKKMGIKLLTNRDDRRKKAMHVALDADGVDGVKVEGEHKDKLVVFGEGVDAICLVSAMRKKACYATLETLEDEKPHAAVNPHLSIAQTPSVNYDQPRYEVYRVVDDPYGPCLIM